MEQNATLICIKHRGSELYAALRASAGGPGILSILKDLAWDMRGEVLGDASAAFGIINRKGLGRTRHRHRDARDSTNSCREEA